MTEYNYFCYAEDKNKDGFQRPRYQVFNKQLTEEEWGKIEKVKMNLKFDTNERYETRYKTAFNKAFQLLNKEDREKITSLPGFNKEDFKKYYGVDIAEEKKTTITLELTKSEMVKLKEILNK